MLVVIGTHEYYYYIKIMTAKRKENSYPCCEIMIVLPFLFILFSLFILFIYLFFLFSLFYAILILLLHVIQALGSTLLSGNVSFTEPK